MLDLKFVLENVEDVKGNLKWQNADASEIDNLGQLDKNRKDIIFKSEELRSERNRVSKEIGDKKRRGEDTSSDQARVQEIKQEIEVFELKLNEIDAQLKQILSTLPNLVLDEVPRGRSESQNEVISEYGTKRIFNFEIKDDDADEFTFGLNWPGGN